MSPRQQLNKQRANFYIDRDVKAALAARSAETGQPQSYILERALRRYLGKDK